MPLSLPNPFIGPRSLGPGEAIFGRNRDLRELYNLLVAQRVALLYSPSGAGKTSLLHASNGLIERLRADFAVWRPTRVNQHPDTACYNPYVWSAITGWESELPEDQQQPAKDLSHMTLDEYFAQRPRKDDEPSSTVLIFDQFEEILRVDPAGVEAKTEFFRQAGDVLRRPNAWGLFVIREDYLAPLDPYIRLLPTHLIHRQRLDLLASKDAADVVLQTAAVGKRIVSQEAAEQLASDLAGESGRVEPLQLQVVCYDLWDRLNRAGIQDVDRPHVSQYANVDTALANYYDAAILKICGEKDVKAQRQLRDWIGKKLVTEQGLRNLLRRGPGDGETEGLRTKTADALVEWLVVRREQRGTAMWYELSHDRLVKPVMASNRKWVDTHLGCIQKLAIIWESQKRSPHLLITDAAKLQAAIDWKNSGEANPVEAEFVEQSQRAARAEQRHTWLFRLMVAGFVLAVGCAIAAILYARRCQ